LKRATTLEFTTISPILYMTCQCEQPTHKTAHLQIAQADTQPKFAKELFSCRRTARFRDI